jgi:hypothetical protein
MAVARVSQYPLTHAAHLSSRIQFVLLGDLVVTFPLGRFWPMQSWKVAGVAALLSAVSLSALAAPAKVCVFDPLGKSGDVHRALEDYRLAMGKFGVELEIKTYVDELVAVEDFRAGQCEGMMATALRTRQFNATAASLDSVGASSIMRNGKIDMDASYDVVRRFITLLSSPKAASMMTVGQYEISGIIPLGAAYSFVNDRQISTLQAAAGKRVAAFDYDKSQAELIQRVGARPVAVNITNFGPMFNNGNVDVIVAPSLVYKPFELYKGIGSKGGVSRFPLTILTYQMVIRKDKFPKDFGQHSREHFVASLDQAMTIARKADKDIPEKLWLDPTSAEIDQYVTMMRQGRVLMANKGIYDKQGLKLIKKIRCSIEPSAAECSERTEMW